MAFTSVNLYFLWMYFLLGLGAELNLICFTLHRGLIYNRAGEKLVVGSSYNSRWGRFCEKVEEHRYLCPAHTVKYVDDVTKDSETMRQKTPT